ncbi:MAG: hypothetical protein AAF488_13530, partial [Planctomycetota bacterium]
MPALRIFACTVLVVSLIACGSPTDAPRDSPNPDLDPSSGKHASATKRVDLFASPDSWSTIVFGGEGLVEFAPVTIEDSRSHHLILYLGDPLTGVLYRGKLDPLFGASRESYR